VTAPVTARHPGGNLPQVVAWATALWPLVAIHVAWLISVGHGAIEFCNPYWDGCTSISRAARQEPAIYWFRATMLPYGWLLAAYWALAWRWLALVNPTARLRRHAMLLMGLTGSVFYLLYATYLGEGGEVPQVLRRYGINLYFSMTVLAQMVLIHVVHRMTLLPNWQRHGFMAIFAALILLGVGSLPFQFFVEDASAMLNALEWCYALLMVAAYPLTAMAWRHTGFRSALTIANGTRS
jgi:GNAT superfamily N-acetyltransferase